jgi:hypothetical protein
VTKPLRAGGEVDAFCTKCRMVLNHRIIAMVGPKPARVECSTCGSHHNFRAGAPGDKSASLNTGGSGRTSATRASSAPRAPRGPTRAEQAALDREKQWEKAIAGRGMSDFRVYRVSQLFKEGDLVRHSKFGDGVVTRIIDQNKVEILFKDEARMLAQGLTA